MRIVVYGLGVSALAALRSLRDKASSVSVVNSGLVDDWKHLALDISSDFSLYSEEDSLNAFLEADYIILSPGIPRNIKYLNEAHKAGVKVISEVEYAFMNSDVPVIAITGSNGKTTTSTMIADSLKAFGKDVFLGGNIGHAYSEIIGSNFDFAVIELSSFQLESIATLKPLISVITNITPNHMERYQSFESYSEAKKSIYKNQDRDSIVITGIQLNTGLKQIRIAPLKDFDFKKSKLVGEHNKLNFFCANEVCLNLCSNYSADIFQKFIDTFKAPKYRLEFKGESHGKEFYNDSKSTNIESTLKAVEAFPCAEELTVILGGKLRQDNVDEFKVLKEKGIGQIIAFGESGLNISKILDVTKVDTLDDAFKYIRKDSKNIILFSPGFPSFDQFKNFEERGEKFNKLFTKFCDESVK